MMNVSEGYGIIKIGGRSFELTPSFYNINKIGDPKEVIDIYNNIASGHGSLVSVFIDAINVVYNCGINDYKILGSVKFNEKTGKTKILQGVIPYDEVIILAQHCLMHGVSGSSNQVKKAKAKNKINVVKEFSSYSYILSCVEYLGMSYEEAEKTTMTRYINLIGAKLTDMRNRGELDHVADNETDKIAYERHLDIVKKRNENRKKKLKG